MLLLTLSLAAVNAMIEARPDGADEHVPTIQPAGTVKAPRRSGGSAKGRGYCTAGRCADRSFARVFLPTSARSGGRLT